MDSLVEIGRNPQATLPTGHRGGLIDPTRVERLIEETFSDVATSSSRDRRTRNRLRTRDSILRAAWRLFLMNGYEATTINDITEQADIGKGTFFAHFGRKADVALYPCHRRIHTVVEQYRARAFTDTSASGTVRAIMAAVARIDGQTYPEARLMTSITLHQFFAEGSLLQEDPPEFEHLLIEVLEMGIRAGEFDSQIDPPAVAALLNAALYSAKAVWLRPGIDVVPFDLGERVDANARAILRGLSPPREEPASKGAQLLSTKALDR